VVTAQVINVNVNEREEKLLEALILMADRVLWSPEAGLFDTMGSSAGEYTREVLVAYGLMKPISDMPRAGRWTVRGEQYRRIVAVRHGNEDFEAELPDLFPEAELYAGPAVALGVSEREQALLEATLKMIG
jgi:hypothetical protein